MIARGWADDGDDEWPDTGTEREKRAKACLNNVGAPHRYKGAGLSDLPDALRSEVVRWLGGFVDCSPPNERLTDASTKDEREAYWSKVKYPEREIPGRAGFALYGRVGTGKTHAMVAALHAVAGKCYPSRFVSAADLSRDFKSSFDEGHKPAEQIIDTYAKTPILAIDDIDKFSPSPFSIECLFTLVDRRYNNDLPILITSNASPGKLLEAFSRFPDFGEAIIDRLRTTSPQWIKLEGTSRRIAGAA